MQRSLWLLSAVSLAAVLSACSPSIPQNPQTPFVVVEFDPTASPPAVPSPTDLVKDPTTGLLNIPVSSANTPTETAFFQSYFNTLNGYPMETPASVAVSAAVNPATLATGVLVLDITNPAAPALVPVTATYTSRGADAGGVITIPPPGGMWTRAHTYAVTIIGGNQTGPFAAVTGANGEQVIASQTWALAASTSNCPTVADGGCAPPVPVCVLPDGGPGGINSGCIPASEQIPAAQAPQLQELQTAAAPLLAALARPPFSIPRANVALSWTFTITSQAEVTFNPPASIPFPNEIVRTGPGGTVSLPLPPGAPPLFAQLIGGLNTLNGFSTTATITTAVDFNFPNNGVSALMQGSIDPASLTPQLAINLIKGPASYGAAASQGAPQWAACVSDVPPGCPAVAATFDGGVKPQVLGIVPLTPLDENTTYIAYLTNAIRDTHQKPVIPSLIFALVRLPVDSAPLYANGKNQVPSLLTDAQAQLLYELQAGQAQIFAGLAANGIPYTSVVQAWAFKTQSEVSVLQQLAALPYALPSTYFPAAPLWVEDVTAVVRPQLTAAGIPTTNVQTIYAGEIMDPFALTGPTGTFNPDGGILPVPIPFIMTVPTGTAPTGGFPVTMFGHGLTGNKTNSYAISNSLAQAGQVMIAIDEVWHGERNTCTGFGAYADNAGKCSGSPICLPDGGYPDTAICTTPTPAATVCNSVGRCELADRTAVASCAYGTPTANQTCFNLGQNECAPDGKCEGADFLNGQNNLPNYSGWNLLNLANLFATRDNFRQQVIDNSQFARVATIGLGAATVPPVLLNPAALSYSGQSLGGFLGTLYTSVGFNVENAGLNVPGGDWVNALLYSPAFQPLLLGFQEGLAANGIATDSPTYDLFIDIARWILDPADPMNMAYYTVHPTGIKSVTGGPSIPLTRRTFVQWILDDQVVPNLTTQQLITAALHDPKQSGVTLTPKDPVTGPLWAYQYTSISQQPTRPADFVDAQILPCARHGFLLLPPNAECGPGFSSTPAGVALTTKAQTQLVGFLSGAAPY